MVQSLRPGYEPPGRKQIAENILDSVHKMEMKKCKAELSGKTVCMDLDGWSNVHNDPINCVSIIETGSSYLVKTIDTSGSKHTTTYLSEMSKEVIKKVSQEFNVQVKSFVTDNAANMASMRRFLQEEGLDVITYGCSAHIANLLAQDLDIPDVKNHIIQIIKYIGNKHEPAAAYKQLGGSKLILPADTRWNSVADALRSYLNNWSNLANMSLSDATNYSKIDTNLKKNTKELLHRLTPVSQALDKL